jgi:DNA-directed RNA polymerase subunit K/omega
MAQNTEPVIAKIKARVIDDIEDAEEDAEDENSKKSDNRKNTETELDQALSEEDDNIQKNIGIEFDNIASDEDGSDDDEPIDKKKETLDQMRDSDYYRTITVTPAHLRVTTNIMSKFEYSEVIGIRSHQIENGSPVFTDVRGSESSYDKARAELLDRKTPLKIIRKVGSCQEEWAVREMIFPTDI